MPSVITMPGPNRIDEERYFILPDPSGSLAADLQKALEELKYERGAAKDLIASVRKPARFSNKEVPYFEYELPTDMEEHFTLRSKRFEAFVISGVHEDNRGRFIGLVVVALSMMGWELRRLFHQEEQEGIEEEKRILRPEWAEEWDMDILEELSDHIQEEAGHLSKHPRLYFPVLAEFVKDPFEEQDDDAYERRKKALQSALGLLNQVLGFKVHSSESGLIPKEVLDQWIEKEVLDEYHQRLEAIDAALNEDPKDGRSWFEKAGLLMSRDRNEEALECLARTVEIESEFLPAWFAMADVFSGLGREEDARKAEEEAKEVQRRIGTPQSKADVYFMLNPFDPRFEKGLPDSKEPDGFERHQCGSCFNLFLYIKDDIWYLCNACGHQGSFEGAAINCNIELENEEIEGDAPVWLLVTLENRTDHEITYSTDDIEVHMNFNEEDQEATQYTFAPLQSPSAPASIEPHGKDTFKVDIRKLEWYDDQVRPTFTPGTYNIDIFVSVHVHAPWAEFKATAESMSVSLKTKK